jgi:protein phosphatase
VDELLAIGEFAARSGLSAKVLRSYAAAGLLVPAAVDPWTGYRYSRAYLFRDGQLSQLTHDHSVVQELIDSGHLAPEQWRTHPERSLLTRALGVAPVVDLDLSRPAVAGSARLLLCTDGLTAQADEAEITGVLSAFADPDQAAVELVRLANSNGGDDNTAVVVVDISPQRVS